MPWRPNRCLAFVASLPALVCSAAWAEAGAFPGEPAEACVPEAKYQRGKLQRVEFMVGEQSRSLLLYMPTSLPTDGSRAPAVLAFHGFHSNPWYFGRLIGITEYAERYGMIAALPFGTSPTVRSELCCPTGCDEECCAKGDKLDILRPCMWNVGSITRWLPRVGQTDDVGMARAAVDHLVGSACVRRGQVSVLGFSMGGMMMHRMACEGADIFSGIASISGSMNVPTEECKPARPVSWIHFCGTVDGGCSGSVNSTFDLFSERFACGSAPQPTYVSASTSCEVRSGCADGVFVEKCLLADLGDEVPGHQRQVPRFVPQPPTNLDAIKYALDRFSTQQVPVSLAAKASPPWQPVLEAAAPVLQAAAELREQLHV